VQLVNKVQSKQMELSGQNIVVDNRKLSFAGLTMSAVIGGTAEKLGGGKFANGAVTGAYVMMFNHLATQHQNQKYSDMWDDFPVTDYTSLNDNERTEHIFKAIKYSNEHGMDGLVPLDKIFSNLKNSMTLQHAGIKINSAFVTFDGESYRVQILVPLYNSIRRSNFLGAEVQFKGGHYAYPFNNGWYRNYNNTYQIAVFGQERYNSLMKWLED